MAHLPRLDVLRGLAILGVLVYHWIGATSGLYHLGWDGNWIDLERSPSLFYSITYPLVLGNAGVVLFFVLSGYLIHAGGLREFRASRFFWKRFWRIYPAYLMALLGAVALLLKNHVWPDPVDFVAHLFLAHDLTDRTFWTFNPSFWSLAVEVQFYLVYPILLWLRRRIGIDGCLVFAGIVSAATFAAGSLWTAPDRILHPTVWHSPLTSWVAWVLGAWLAEKHRASDQPALRGAGWLVLGSVACLIGAEVWRPLSVFVLSSVGIAAVLIDRYGRMPGRLVLAERGLGHLGIISYSVYLTHQPMFLVMSRKLHLEDRPFGVPHIALFGIAGGIACAIGWISYRVFEQGGLWLGRKLQPTYLSWVDRPKGSIPPGAGSVAEVVR